jgi:hippurate hydrolase
VNANLPATGGGEDFAFMLKRKQGSFIFLGNGTESEGCAHGVHTPHYDFNDAAIPYGVAYWVQLVRRELGLPA